MNRIWTFLLAASLVLVACGDEDDPDTQSDSGDGHDASTPANDAGLDAASPSPDAGRDAASPGADAANGAAEAGSDASSKDASGGGADAGPKPIEVDCGASIDPVDCPVCANSSGCATPTYTDNGNGTVTSSCCGLVWQKAQMEVDRTWVEAYQYCANLTLAGGGFRLPSIAELNTLLISDTWPSIDLSAFPNTPREPVWTSTAYGSDYAWEIHFGESAVQGGELTNGENVRCVR